MKTTNKYFRLSKSSGFWEGAKIRPENLVKLALRARSNIGQVGMILAAIGGAIFSGNSAIAQIAPDKTLGAESSVVTPNVDIKGVLSDRIDGGATRGTQLFHSFSEFNINTGRGAYFSNPAGIESIFSRVTGNNASNIAGKLGVLGNANLFLLNPNGIIFGPNASLDLGGSFLASTANSFNFGNGKEFSATNPTGAPLLAVTVPLGVQFNQAQPNAIANSANLAVGTGQNLTLLGGTVASTGNLSAPGGQIAVAAVPGGSVVNLNSSGQLLNIDTSSTAGSSLETQSSLAKLLTENNQISLPELTVKSDGNVELAGSGLSVGDGDVVAKNVSAQTATLTAKQNLTLVESQLNTTGDLNLLAGDTVRVRDTVANPFVAQAGGKLLVQGKQGVDIFALNNSSSGLVSGGDMILRSANTVGGDAHYWAGGSFRIEQMDGSLGGLFSPYDPIIRAAGDVNFDSYEGASLHIFAGGSVTITGNVNITGKDAISGLPEEIVPLSDDGIDGISSTVVINGVAFPTLDIRAGVRADAIYPQGNLEILQTGFMLTPQADFPGNGNSIDPNPLTTADTQATGANITIGSIKVETAEGAQVFLSNQYQPNTSLGEGSINQPNADPTRGSIEITGGTLANNELGSYSIISYGNPVTIDARGNVKIAQGIITGTNSTIGKGGDIKILSGGKLEILKEPENPIGSLVSLTNGNGGNITLTAANDIIAKGNITSQVVEGYAGKGGNIILTSNFGEINTTGITITSKSSDGTAGNVTLTAHGNIRSGNIEASSNSNDTTDRTIKLESSQGSVFLDQVTLSAKNTGSGYAGIIDISGTQGIVQITGSDIKTDGYFGIFNIDAGNDVLIRDSSLTSQTTSDLPAPAQNFITQAGDINVTSRNGNININNNSKVNASTSARIQRDGNNININAGNINIEATNGSVTVGSESVTDKSQVLSRNSAGQGNAGRITIKARDTVTINGNQENGTATVGTDVASGGVGNGNDINIAARSVDITNEAIVAASIISGTGERAGNVNIKATDKVSVSNNAVLFSEIGSSSVGNGGTVNITAPNITLDQGTLATVVRGGGQGKGGDINIQTRTLSLRNGSLVATSTSGDSTSGVLGGAGNVTIQPYNTEADNTISVDGQGSNKWSFLVPSIGTDTNPSAILSTVEAKALGINNGGNIDIKTGTGSLSVTNGARVSASNFAQGRAGDVTVNAKSVLLDGNQPNTDFKKLVENNKTPQAGLLAEATEGGTAGDLKITTDELSIKNGAKVTVNSPKGQAGNIEISANKIFLDNGGILATTGSTENEGNIILKGKDNSALAFIVLWNKSNIAADAQNSANGGNININSQLLIAFPVTGEKSSDITANALATGSGGKVNITAGIYGFKLSNQKPSDVSSNLFNDIAASSQTGLAGTVSVGSPIVDPNRGLIQLPEELADSSNLIAQSCPVGGQRASSQFVVTGRGGLPPSPDSALNSDVLVGNAAANNPAQSSFPDSASVATVEAQGVNIGPNGEILLTANPTQLTSYSSWQRFTSCNAK